MAVSMLHDSCTTPCVVPHCINTHTFMCQQRTLPGSAGRVHQSLCSLSDAEQCAYSFNLLRSLMSCTQVNAAVMATVKGGKRTLLPLLGVLNCES